MTARLRPAAAVAAVLVAALLGACTSGVYAETQIPTATPSVTAAPSPSPSGSATTTPATCDNATQSYNPLPSLTGDAANNAVAAIRNSPNKKLRVGVSADSLLLGSRDPITGQIVGFDIDMAKAVAKAIFGDENQIELIVISAADRIPALQKKTVDLVVRNMTMNCARWQEIAFSSEYYQSGVKILVKKTDPTTTLAGLAGKKVCAATSTTSQTAVQSTPGVIPVLAATHTGCLVLFQEGKVDAIAGDDTVLAGLAKQDPYAFVPQIQPLTSEPYGIGVNKDQIDFVRYINRVVDTVKSDGRWKASYDKWFAVLGPAPAPPQSLYGRG